MGMRNPIRGNMKRLSFSTPNETDEALSALAQEWGVSKSQVVNLMIERGLGLEILTAEGGEILYSHPEKGTQVIYRPGVNHLDNPESIL